MSKNYEKRNSEKREKNLKYAIGIYMLEAGKTTITEGADNRRYVYTPGDNGFTAEAAHAIYYPVNGSDVDFLAYYPQQTLTEGSMNLNLTDQSNLLAIDLMAAKTVSTAGAPLNIKHKALDFNFTPKLTKIQVNITLSADVTADELRGLKVDIIQL